MDSKIGSLFNSFEEEILGVVDLKNWEDVFLIYLGKKGKLNELFTLLKTQPKQEIASSGQKLNDLKIKLEKILSDKRDEILSKKDNDWIDLTIPAQEVLGNTHLITKTINKIRSIFTPLGFAHMSYNEVEWEYFAFEALNIPSTHPARDDVETFFVDTNPSPKWGKMVLTPHTSSGQIREMKRLKSTPPIKMINISKCYRPNWDTTHVPVFHQFEGLSIDTDISIPHLKGTIQHFVSNFFGEGTTIRLRPYNFRFTEPSFEVDISCKNCQGKGNIAGTKCRVCKYGWLELGGAGMVHPQVLEAGGIDPSKFSGWAFGFGIERVAMMKGNLKLPDLRMFYSNDIDLLRQF